jgi:hypothetical protein
MAKGTPKWTPEDVDYLRTHYGSERAAHIAAKLGRSEKAITQKARLEGLARKLTASYTPYFREVDTPVKAYVLGVLAADGWVDDEGRIGIQVVEKDRGIAELVRDQLRPSGRIYSLPPGKPGWQPVARFVIGSVQMARELARYGIVPRKTRTLTWPSMLSPELHSSYVCGYFDGDGHLTVKPHPYWTICSASQPFLESMGRCIELGSGVSIARPRRAGSIWAISKHGPIPVRALDAWMHRDVPGLERKRLPRAGETAG